MDLKEETENRIGEKIINFSGYTGIITTVTGKKYFFKRNNNPVANQCEINGLEELKKANAICIVEVYAFGSNYIVMELIETGSLPGDYSAKVGENIAKLHRFTAGEFGFYEDNFIGLNPQPNMAAANEKYDWITFYYNKRLLFQYKLAEKNKLLSDKLKKGFIRLEKEIHKILDAEPELPSLLHGDLWAGNILINSDEIPVLIDPAVYYGNREAELAMTALFGGFTSVFYDSYNKAYPLQDGWQYRMNIYKLYHVLNHLNIFGNSYLIEAENLLWSYLK